MHDTAGYELHTGLNVQFCAGYILQRAVKVFDVHMHVLVVGEL